MKALTTWVGRIAFALPFGIFGLFHFFGAEKMAGMVPHWLPGGGVLWVYLTGVALVAGAAGLITGFKAEQAALGLAALMAVFIVTIHLPGIRHPEMQQMAMMSLLKDLALMGGALVIAGTARSRR